MTKNGILKAVVFLVLLAGVSTSGAFAQLTISGGFAMSSMKAEMAGQAAIEGKIGLGANIYFDYLLPINIPLSLGAEIGGDTASIENDTALAIPVLLRAAYHFDLDPRLDLYLVGKLGYTFGTFFGEVAEYIESAGGFAFGIDIGAAYYFTSLIGVFAEAGADGYLAKTKFKAAEGIPSSIDTPFYRFVTFGLSFRK
jgi:hypothetical protein